MKRNVILFPLILALLLSAAGCSASVKSQSAPEMNAADYSYAYNMPAEAPMMTEEGFDVYSKDEAMEAEGFAAPVIDYAEKIIYTAEANVQTLTFDESVEQITQMVQACGGFVESSSITGKDFYASTRKYKTYRNATFVLRIPTTELVGFQEALNDVGNVTYLNTNTQNITTSYYDTQGRLDTYRVEEDRLLAMLEKCETVEDMITIEGRLSEVRYGIESLTSKLNRYDQQVAFSTLTVYLNEVAELTEEEPVQRTYWQQIVDGFRNSLKGVGEFFADLFKLFLISIPYLVLLAIVCAIVIPLLRRAHRKRKERRLQSKLEKEQNQE